MSPPPPGPSLSPLAASCIHGCSLCTPHTGAAKPEDELLVRQDSRGKVIRQA